MKVIPAESNKRFQAIAESSTENNSLDEYDRLKATLFQISLGLSVAIALVAWYVYGQSTALNYLLGACTGVVYLRMLAKSVDRLGNQKDRLGNARIFVFIGVMILAARLRQLQILPVFLGFMTYKAAILVYFIKDITPWSRSA